jgi:hypothetical protein
MPTAMAAKQRPRFKQVQSRIYTDPKTGAILFVPVDDMWIFREAAKPTAALARAGLSLLDWAQWLRNFGDGRPWLADLLYTPPKGPGCGQTAELPADAFAFKLSPQMMRFREQISMVQISAAAKREVGDARAGRKGKGESHVSHSLVTYWLDKHGDQPWFRDWLARGRDVPEHVTVVTRRQAATCRRGWDYIAHLDAIAPRKANGGSRTGSASNALYAQWFKNILPANDARWIKWLFALTPAPDDCFVVSATHMKWRKARLADGGLWIDVSQECNELKAAGQVGARELLETFIKPTMENQQRFRQLCVNKALGKRGSCGSGLMAPGFFLPTESMLAFRQAADAATNKQAIRTLKDHPCFDRWFFDCVMLRTHARPEADGKQVEDVGEATPTLAGSAAPIKPRWDRNTRTLWFGNRAVKQYRQPAQGQETILSTFEEDGWPSRIDDPLDPGKLRDVLRNLRESLPGDSPLKFESDGKGQGVLWEPIKNSPTPLPHHSHTSTD